MTVKNKGRGRSDRIKAFFKKVFESHLTDFQKLGGRMSSNKQYMLNVLGIFFEGPKKTHRQWPKFLTSGEAFLKLKKESFS